MFMCIYVHVCAFYVHVCVHVHIYICVCEMKSSKRTKRGGEKDHKGGKREDKNRVME